MSSEPPIALTIAGSDSGGGAGIQADLKTFAALKVYGCSAVTAITAQSTTEVRSVWPVPAAALRDQLGALAEDMPMRALKVGMLGSAENLRVVAAFLAGFDGPSVVDPVLLSTSGAALLAEDAQAALRTLLIPRCALLTPNLPEVGVLLGSVPSSPAQMAEAGRAFLKMGTQAALIKGGHAPGERLTDVLVQQDAAPLELHSTRISGRATHGTGCTYAAAITAHLALGFAMAEAVERAHAYVQGALRSAQAHPIGRGRGPLHHLHPFYPVQPRSPGSQG